MIKKLIIVLIIVQLIFSQTGVGFANPGLAADFLYELALKCYRTGNLAGALYETKKILLIEPTNKEALGLIEEIRIKQLKTEEIITKEKERRVYEIAPVIKKEEEIIPPQALEAEKEPIIIERVLPGPQPLVTEKEEKPVVIEMERILPVPKKMPDEWVIKPEEMITSTELEGYQLFNEAKLLLNAKLLEIPPVIIKDNTIRIPLEKLARALGLVVFSPERDTLTIINSEGLPLEFRVSKREVLLNKREFALLNEPVLKYEGWTMIAIGDLDKALGLGANWDKDNKIISINTLSLSKEFITFTNTKPKELKAEEIKTLPEEQPPILGRLTPMPPKLQPDVRLVVNNNVSSFYNNSTKRSLENEQVSITGNIYDYIFNSDFKWKETDSGNFINDGKYIGFFKKDHWLEFLNLSTTIPNLRSQTESYEGARFTKFYEPFSTQVYAGQRDITVSGPSAIGPVRYYGNILGVEQKYASDGINITQEIISTDAEAETEQKSGTTAFPVKNLISVTDAALKLPYQTQLSGQFAFCDYRPDNDRGNSVQDNDWRIETKTDGEKLLWGYKYEFVGDKYASLGNPSGYQDYKGWDLYSRYNLTKRVSFSGGYSESQDNVDGIETDPTNENTSLSLGTNFSLFTNTNLGLNWIKGESQTRDPASGMSNSTSYDYLFSLSQNWQEWMLLATYDRYELNAQTDSFSDTGSFSLFKFIPKSRGSYLRARQQLKKTSYKGSSTPVTTDYTSDFGFRYYLKSNFSVFGNLIIENIRTEGQKQTSPLSFNSGIQWDINKDIGFGLDFNSAPYDLSIKQNRNTKGWSILFRFFNRFQINSPSKWGRIKGRIFRDLNANGIYDYGEPVFSGVTVRVADEFVAQSDKNGFYILEEVVPGDKTVNIEMKELPIDVVSGIGEAINVNVESRKTTVLDFPILEASTIKGKVFVDENNNGTYDFGEEGLEGVDIYLSPKTRTAQSDENGGFSFDILPPGNYEVSIDYTQLPIEYKLASSEKIQIKLDGNQLTFDVYFSVIPKPVVTKKF